MSTSRAENEFEGFGEITYGPVPLSKEEEEHIAGEAAQVPRSLTALSLAKLDSRRRARANTHAGAGADDDEGSADGTDVGSMQVETGDDREAIRKRDEEHAIDLILHFWGEPEVVLDKRFFPRKPDGSIIEARFWKWKLLMRVGELSRYADVDVAMEYLSEAIDFRKRRCNRPGQVLLDWMKPGDVKMAMDAMAVDGYTPRDYARAKALAEQESIE